MTTELMTALTEDEIAEALCDAIEDIHDELGPAHTVDSATIRAAAVVRLFGGVAA